MNQTYRPRRVLAVLAALVLPAATCGVAPALRDLMLRTQRLEEFVANAHLPPVLVDDHGTVIGRVLEYNDLMLYSSVLYQSVDDLRRYGLQTQPDAVSRARTNAFATVLYTVPGQAPVVLEARRAELLAPVGFAETYVFESVDCSGDFWISRNALDWFPDKQSLFGIARIAPPGRTLYTANLDSPGVPITPRSVLHARAGSEAGELPDWQNACFRVDELDDWWVHPDTTWIPFRPVHDLDAYAPPFRIADQRDLWIR